jgi:hypothetical protein
VEQLSEGVAVAGDMGRQQLGVTAFPLAVPPDTHGRTVTNRCSRGTSPGWAAVNRSKGPDQDAAWTVISEMAALLLPSVVPSVEIHTSRFDVGAPDLTGMVL